MPRLRSGILSPAWFEFATALVQDLEPLGRVATVEANGDLLIESVPPPGGEGLEPEKRWSRPHALRHQKLIQEHRDEILAFEHDFAPLFVDMEKFQPSAVRPVLQLIDFNQPDHMRIVDYLRLYQSVTPGKPVGRRMGLFIWDVGQGEPLLFGAVVLASAGFSQQIRDARFGWKPDLQKNLPNHDPVARAIREAGLGRIMQLSMACALPPYSWLSGAWLAALTPLTALGLDGFKRSLLKENRDADLAVIVTTTAMAVSGAPFRGHRVVQLAPKGISAIPNSSGNIYSRAEVADGIAPLFAHFEDFVSPRVRAMAETLFAQEKPHLYAKRKDPEESGLAYALRRCSLQKSIFNGNEMGIHIGALGADTLDYLRTGQPRPLNARPLLDWDQVVDVWTRRFLPAPPSIGESTHKENKADHRGGRQRRLDGARNYPADRIKLSSAFAVDDPANRVRLNDIMPKPTP